MPVRVPSERNSSTAASIRPSVFMPYLSSSDRYWDLRPVASLFPASIGNLAFELRDGVSGGAFVEHPAADGEHRPAFGYRVDLLDDVVDDAAREVVPRERLVDAVGLFVGD